MLDTKVKHAKIPSSLNVVEMEIAKAVIISESKKDLIKQIKQLISEVCEEVIGNIKRFDDKEKGVDWYAGWNQCLDTITIDFKEILGEE